MNLMLRLLLPASLAFGLMPGPGIALDAPAKAEAAAPEGGPLRRDCPKEPSDPLISGSDLAQQLQHSVRGMWSIGRITPEMHGAEVQVRLCPSKDPYAPLDVFIMDYKGPDGAAQEAIFGSLMTAIRRLATSGPGFQAAMQELGRGDPDLVTLDMTFTIAAPDEEAAP